MQLSVQTQRVTLRGISAPHSYWRVDITALRRALNSRRTRKNEMTKVAITATPKGMDLSYSKTRASDQFPRALHMTTGIYCHCTSIRPYRYMVHPPRLFPSYRNYAGVESHKILKITAYAYIIAVVKLVFCMHASFYFHVTYIGPKLKGLGLNSEYLIRKIGQLSL